ncbi:hypothetical protein [Bacillus methanolicus]|uniref:Putative membrane protein n=1 Tax=Bacillus methanolicus (strain MGA3 / ATCC 53907) TaxID=796606 RepID=I3DUP2_BACMM|nr:hypothetical protein [Bacillus methanolicus]AIE61159.1 putative membrane protein [Bacillus methanolicus MGA3]EIJ77963.1 hypothetical protein MGA3_16471 [Bacillus methanolicus MGA3]
MCFGSCGYGYAAPAAPNYGVNFALIVILFVLFILLIIVVCMFLYRHLLSSCKVKI